MSHFLMVDQGLIGYIDPGSRGSTFMNGMPHHLHDRAYLYLPSLVPGMNPAEPAGFRARWYSTALEWVDVKLVSCSALFRSGDCLVLEHPVWEEMRRGRDPCRVLLCH